MFGEISKLVSKSCSLELERRSYLASEWKVMAKRVGVDLSTPPVDENQLGHESFFQENDFFSLIQKLGETEFLSRVCVDYEQDPDEPGTEIEVGANLDHSQFFVCEFPGNHVTYRLAYPDC